MSTSFLCGRIVDTDECDYRPLQKHDGQSAGASTSDDTSWIEGMGVFKKYLKLPENVEFPTS